MKREDLKTRLTAVGVTEDKLGEVVDYIMGQNGADINALKEEVLNLKNSNAAELSALQEENKNLKSKVDGYKDYEELKKFKEETIEKAENSKKVEFLKSQGCKHPDLIMSKVDFTKAKYDEEAKTYTGLDDCITELKGQYGDLFEEQGAQRMTPTQKSQSTDTFKERYLAEHPEMAKFMQS